MNSLSSISRKLAVPLILLLLVAGSGCKSKKKAMEAAAAEQARMEQEAARKQKNDKEEEERKRQEEAAEADRQRKEREAEAARASAPGAQLDGYFTAIAGAATPTAANGSIQEALALFASGDAPVLIVISESGGVKDYDRPTTIKAYLNYLKDVKKNTNRVSNLQFNDSNKIVEVELVKNR